MTQSMKKQSMNMTAVELALIAALAGTAGVAEANCKGTNSPAGCTAAAQSGNAVAQANAEGGQGGNASNKSYGLPSVVPGAPYACPTWTFTANLFVAGVAYVRTATDCLDELAKSAAVARACEMAQGNTTESLRLRTQLAAAKVPEAAELALRRDIGRLGAMGAQGLLQFCPGIKGSYEAAKKAEDSCGPGKQTGIFGDCDPIVTAEPPKNKALEDRLNAVSGELDKAYAERDAAQKALAACNSAQKVDNSAPIKAILAKLQVQRICGGRGTLRPVQVAASTPIAAASGVPQQCTPAQMTVKCLDSNNNEVNRVEVAVIPANAVQQLRDLGVTFAPGK